MPCSWWAWARAGRGWKPLRVERGVLVRVLAVAQHRGAVPRGADPGGEAGAVGAVGVGVAHPRRHVHVVGRGVHEGLRREPLALLEREAAAAHGIQHVVVGRRVGDHGDARVVLGRRADHGGAADVDLLDALVGAGPRGHGGGERVEVDHDQLERLDPEVGELGDVVGLAGVGEDAGVHPRVQRLDPALEALGEAGEVLDLGHRQAERLDERGRATGRDQGDAGLVQAADELLEAGLVVDGDEGAADGSDVLRRAGGGDGGHAMGSLRVGSGSSGAPRRAMPRPRLPGGDPPSPVVAPESSGGRRTSRHTIRGWRERFAPEPSPSRGNGCGAKVKVAGSGGKVGAGVRSRRGTGAAGRASCRRAPGRRRARRPPAPGWVGAAGSARHTAARRRVPTRRPRAPGCCPRG